MSASTSPRSECRCPALPLEQGFRTRPASVSRLGAGAISGAVDAGSLPSVAARGGERVFLAEREKVCVVVETQAGWLRSFW